MPHRAPLVGRVITAALIAAVLAPAGAAARDDALIVRYAPGTDATERVDARRDADVTYAERLPLDGAEVVVADEGTSVQEAVARLERSEDVLYAERDVERTAARRPDDPLFPSQWGLLSTGQAVAGRIGTAGVDIGAADAWEATTGAESVRIAVVDSGIDPDHRDLQPNIAVNDGEVAGNGRDDDGNGLIDDVRGWDLLSRDAQPLDDNGHGTHVAGTIAARGNDGYGVTGVAWRAGIVPIRVLGADGSGRLSDVIAAYSYAANAGARIVNISLGGAAFSQAERDAIAAAHDMLVVAAAGNDGRDLGAANAYPCEYDLPNVVCVGASGRDDGLVPFSNHGASSVDVVAPGVDIASTFPGGKHVLMDGTSMATPHVSGAAALAFAAQPALSAARVRDLLVSSAEPVAALSGRVAGGRLDVARLLSSAGVSVGTDSGAQDQAPGPAQQPGPSETGTTEGGEPPPEDLAEPVEPEDRLAPGASLSAPRRAALAGLLRTGLAGRLTCSEACTVQLELRRGTTTLARRILEVRRAGRTRFRLRVGTPKRRLLRTSRSLRLTAAVDDEAGNRRLVARRLTVRR